MKKLAVLLVFVFAVATLSSCRSKKSSCDYSKIQTQEVQQDVVTACADEE